MKKSKLILIVGVVLLLSGIATVAYGLSITEKEYQYEVKTEQVIYGDSIESTTPVEDLSTDEQKALMQAYRQSDRFLSGASASIWVDDRLDIQEGWVVVSIEGVLLLTSIEHTGERYEDNSYTFFGMLITMFSVPIMVMHKQIARDFM